MTLAERYNAQAQRLLPHMADSLAVDPTITCAGEIDDILFSAAASISAGWRSPFSP